MGGGSWGWGAVEACPESIRMREIENFVRPWGGGGLEWGKLKILPDVGGRGEGGWKNTGIKRKEELELGGRAFFPKILSNLLQWI